MDRPLKNLLNRADSNGILPELQGKTTRFNHTMTPHTQEVLFEMVRVGGIMRVTAIDAATGTEVVIQGRAADGPEILKCTALAKLRYVMGRKKA